MSEIADLFATLGLKVNAGQWAQADEQIKKTQRAMDALDKYAQSLGVSRGAVMGAARQAAAQEREAQRSQVAAARTVAAQERAAVREEAAKQRAAAAAMRAVRSLEREEEAAARRAQTMRGRALSAQRAAQRRAAMEAKKAHDESAKAAEESAKRTEHAFGSVKTTLAGVVAYMGSHFAYEHLIASNQEMQDTTISLAATIQGQLGGSFQEATGKANDLYKEWQKFSMVSGSSTTAEFVEFGKSLAASTFAAKGSLKDLNELTEQGMIAAKVLAAGRPAGYAALEISEMLSGNVRNSQMFVKQLLGFIHMTEDEFRALDDKGRLNATLRALNSPAFKDAGKAMGASFSGVTSTLKDIFQIATRTAGEPIFGAITNSLHRLNDWLLKNQGTIDRITGAIADGLAVAWDLLVQVWSKAYAVFDRNRDVLTRIAQKVGSELWFAFQLVVAAVDELLDQADGLLKFFDHGLGKFLLDVLLAPGPLMVIADLLDRIGVTMKDIMDMASFNIFAKLFGAIFGDGEPEPEADQGSGGAKKAPLPGLSVRDALAKRAQDLADQAQQSRSTEERNQLLERSARYRDMVTPAAQPSLPAGNGPVAMTVNVGDINVHSPNADPEAVAQEVHRVFDEKLGDHLRRTMDEVA